MIPFTHLAMLITAFFGVDLSDAKMDIEPRYNDPDLVALYCSGFRR